jgi:hypothetical protein
VAKAYESDAMAAIHETMDELHAAGLLDDAKMRAINEMCLLKMSTALGRIGFLAGQISVPDDFDHMGEDDIESLFDDKS